MKLYLTVVYLPMKMLTSVEILEKLWKWIEIVWNYIMMRRHSWKVVAYLKNFKVSTICLCNQTEFSSVVIGMVRISQLPSVVLKKKETCLCDNRRKRYFPFFNILTEILYYAPWVLERYLFFCPFIISLFLFFYFSILGVVR